MRKILTLVVSLAALAGGQAWAQQKIDQRRPAAADAVVSVRNVSGSVTVTGWDKPEVAVTGTAQEGVESVDVTGGPARVDVTVKIRQGAHNNSSADLDIKVPKGGKADVDVVSAGASVSGVSGGVELKSVSGPVKITGPVGQVTVKSVSGQVEVENASGSVSASSVSGTLSVRGGAFEDCHFNTVSGKVVFAGALSAKGSLKAEAVSGSIDLTLPADIGAAFSLDSFSGDIKTAFGDGKVETPRFGPGKKASFTVGSGAALVSVKTLSGTITVGKR